MHTLGIVLGYHGCDRSVGEKVLAGNVDLRISNNDHDWLGSGIYFWENNPKRALEWARQIQKNPQIAPKAKIKESFIIGSIIQLGDCLDLLETESVQLVKNAHHAFVNSCKTTGLPIPKNFGGEDVVMRKLDCAVINYLHEVMEKDDKSFDTVRAAFLEGGALYENAGFRELTHIQICVRNPKQIIGYFRVREDY